MLHCTDWSAVSRSAWFGSGLEPPDGVSNFVFHTLGLMLLLQALHMQARPRASFKTGAQHTRQPGGILLSVQVKTQMS